MFWRKEMKRIIALLTIIAMLIPASACKPRENNGNVTVEPTVTTEPTVTPEAQEPEDTGKRLSISIAKKHDGLKDKKGKEIVSIDYDTASVSVDDEPIEYFGKALQEKADSFLKFFYDVNTVELSQMASDAKYGADYKISPQRMDEGAVSFVLTEYADTMGVHPNTDKLTFNYDIEKQCQIKLEDLTSDYAALEKLLHEYVLKLMSEHKYAGEFFDGYKDSISSIVADGLWYFSDDGITFICNTDTIAPYAVGIMEFTVPYEELSSYIDKRWLPKEHRLGAEDTTSVSIASDYDISGYKVFKLNLDSKGRTFAIATDKTIYDVTLSSVTYDSDSEVFSVNRVMYKCSRLSSKELLEITADIPEVIPNLQLTYKLMDGSTVTNYISESGKDGSLLLSKL
jgi:hypothetical protein